MSGNEWEGADDCKICYVCGVAVGDRWFARITQQNRRICLCSPRCELLFLEAPPPSPELQDKRQYYKEQDTLLKIAKSITGELHSYDAMMGQAAY